MSPQSNSNKISEERILVITGTDDSTAAINQMSLQQSKATPDASALSQHIALGYQSNLTAEERNNLYDELAERHDTCAINIEYNGPRVAAEEVAEYIPASDRSKVCVLDIGAGTGLVGENLSKLGFTTIDAVESCTGMVTKAKQKNIYRNFICESMTDKPLQVKADTYDVITAVGCHGPNHVPSSAFYEMLRISKKGAIICVVTRSLNYECNDGYDDALFPVCHELEKNKKWKKRNVHVFPNYIRNVEGIIAVYEVL